MRSSLFLAFTLVSSVALAAPCSLPELEGQSDQAPECLFYVGTKNYREKNYAAAFGSWDRLRNLRDVPAKSRPLVFDAYNNLGYLLYMGLGTDIDTDLALHYWRIAYDAGQPEAAYHLCHALAKPELPEYSPEPALRYCVEGLRRYKAARPGASDETIVQQIRGYIARLEAR